MDYEDRSGGMEFDVTYVVEHAGRAELRNTLFAEYRRHVGKTLDDVLLRSILDQTMGVLRATDPKTLPKDRDLAVGPDADWNLSVALAESSTVVFGWGCHAVKERVTEVVEVVKSARRWPALCLGRTKDGHPRHPLFVSYETPMVVYGG